MSSKLPSIALALMLAAPGLARAESDPAIATGVARLLEMEEGAGEWPYEGVYRVGRTIPVGYRVGGAAIVCQALLYAAPDDEKARAARQRGLAFILDHLDHPLMKASTADRYDVRVWGQAYALDLLCALLEQNQAGARKAAVERAIPGLVAVLLKEEIAGGGWNYANRKRGASFVTASVTQALLRARARGAAVPDPVLRRARAFLEASRNEAGAFAYSGRSQRTPLPGSIARGAIAELTLLRLGGSSLPRLRAAIEAFHKHWIELEKRRKKTGTHVGPYGVAPYYFYYGHRYLAQAIEALPEGERPAARARLRKTIMKTRDDDGTWNDRVFPRSRNFGTAMMILALLGPKAPEIPEWRARKAPRYF